MRSLSMTDDTWQSMYYYSSWWVLAKGTIALIQHPLSLEGGEKCSFTNKNRFLAAVLQVFLHSWLATGPTAVGFHSPTAQLSPLSRRLACARRRFGLSDSDFIAGLCTSVLSFERSLLLLRLSRMTSHNNDSFLVPSTAPGKQPVSDNWQLVNTCEQVQ